MVEQTGRHVETPLADDHQLASVRVSTETKAHIRAAGTLIFNSRLGRFAAVRDGDAFPAPRTVVGFVLRLVERNDEVGILVVVATCAETDATVVIPFRISMTNAKARHRLTRRR